jgi:hypothetical protein
MRLTAVFESWHIGDGNYPPLKNGQSVNLSFQVEPVGKLERTNQPVMFDVAEDAECAFVSEVIRIYRQPSERPIGVQAGEFRFYIEDESIANFAVETRSGALERYCLTTTFGWSSCTNTPSRQISFIRCR